MDRWSIQLEGVGDLLKKLDELPEKVQKKEARLATAKGGRIIRNEMKKRVPVETGTLKKSLHSKVKTYKRSGNVVAIVGPRADKVGIVTLPDGSVEKRVPANYAHLVELGTAHSPAQPFMRQSFDAKSEQAANTIIDGLWEGIKRNAAK